MPAAHFLSFPPFDAAGAFDADVLPQTLRHSSITLFFLRVADERFSPMLFGRQSLFAAAFSLMRFYAMSFLRFSPLSFSDCCCARLRRAIERRLFMLTLRLPCR